MRLQPLQLERGFAGIPHADGDRHDASKQQRTQVAHDVGRKLVAQTCPGERQFEHGLIRGVSGDEQRRGGWTVGHVGRIEADGKRALAAGREGLGRKHRVQHRVSRRARTADAAAVEEDIGAAGVAQQHRVETLLAGGEGIEFDAGTVEDQVTLDRRALEGETHGVGTGRVEYQTQ